MSSDDPRRLKGDPQVSPFLSEVLETLCERDGDAARIARISGRLGQLLDAPPSAAHSLPPTTYRTSTVSKSGVALKLIVGALMGVSVAVTLWMSSDRPAMSPVSSAAVGTVAPRSEQIVAANLEPVHTQPPPLAAASVPEQRTEPLAPGASDAHRLAPRADRPTAARRRSLAASAGDAPQHSTRAAPEAQATPAVAAQSTPHPVPVAPAARVVNDEHQPTPPEEPAAAPVEPTAAAVVGDEPKPAPPAQLPVPASVEPPPPSELELLLGARAVLASDAKRALQLLAEHETRYAHGVLAPEREVLAIDALQRMGRQSDAQRRRARFEQSHPESFHVKRKQH